jgi:multicomponent Na+:H+ antiporter subunit G
MAETLPLIGGGLAAAGALLVLIGALGMLRFPDVYTRIHAASITDTGGATLMILGLGLISGLSAVTLKLGIVWVLVMLTSPVAANAISHAAFSAGHAPWIGGFRIVSGDRRQGGRQGERKP